MKPTLVTGQKFYRYTCVLRVYFTDVQVTVHDFPLESLTRGHQEFESWMKVKKSNKLLFALDLYHHGKLIREWTAKEGEIDVSLLTDAYQEASTLPPWLKKDEKAMLIKEGLPFMIKDVEHKDGDPRNQVNPGAKWLVTVQLVDPHKKLDATHENPKKHPRTYALSLDEDEKRNVLFKKLLADNKKALPYGPVVLTLRRQYQQIEDYTVLPDEVKAPVEGA